MFTSVSGTFTQRKHTVYTAVYTAVYSACTGTPYSPATDQKVFHMPPLNSAPNFTPTH